MTAYSLPWWYIAVTEVAWYASQLWLRLVALLNR